MTSAPVLPHKWPTISGSPKCPEPEWRAWGLWQVNVGDRLQHFKNRKVKPVIAWLRRAVLRMLKRETYFRLW